MKTLKDLKKTLGMQYTFEKYIEIYNNSKNESDRYFIKHELVEYILDCNFSIVKVLDYLRLQPEKFEPFIKLFENVEDTIGIKETPSYFNKKDVNQCSPFMVVFGSRRSND